MKKPSAKFPGNTNSASGRKSLVDQTVKAIQSGIVRCLWQRWLPSERILAEALFVSRSTLRKAVAILEKDGVLRAEHPKGTRIVRQTVNIHPSRQFRAVALLTPVAPAEMRPKIAAIISRLREKLSGKNCRLHLFHGGHYFSPGAPNRLARLVSSNPHDCWVLLQVTEKTKRWFYNNKIPSVMFGTCPPGVLLPSIDLDYYAICRHAVTRMIETGHRKLVYIPDLMLDNLLTSGDIKSMEGFRDAIGSFNDPLLTGKIVHFHNTREWAVDMLRHMFSSGNPPTGLLISNPYFFLLTLTYLQKAGIRVPGNVSLICRSDDLFLDYINPVPTKYKFVEQAFSDPLLNFIVRIMEGRPIKDTVIRIMPDYQEGGTLGPPTVM